MASFFFSLPPSSASSQALLFIITLSRKPTWPFEWPKLADRVQAKSDSVQQDKEIPPEESATYVGKKQKVILKELAIIELTIAF